MMNLLRLTVAATVYFLLSIGGVACLVASLLGPTAGGEPWAAALFPVGAFLVVACARTMGPLMDWADR